MTTLLQQAFEKASTLPSNEQNAVAEWLIAELESERKWDNLFTTSPSLLEQLASEAL